MLQKISNRYMFTYQTSHRYMEDGNGWLNTHDFAIIHYESFHYKSFVFLFSFNITATFPCKKIAICLPFIHWLNVFLRVIKLDDMLMTWDIPNIFKGIEYNVVCIYGYNEFQKFKFNVNLLFIFLHILLLNPIQ